MSLLSINATRWQGLHIDSGRLQLRRPTSSDSRALRYRVDQSDINPAAMLQFALLAPLAHLNSSLFVVRQEGIMKSLVIDVLRKRFDPLDALYFFVTVTIANYDILRNRQCSPFPYQHPALPARYIGHFWVGCALKYDLPVAGPEFIVIPDTA